MENPAQIIMAAAKEDDSSLHLAPPHDLRGGKALVCPVARGMETSPGLNLTLYPNRGSKELSTKLGALILNAWNSEKIIAFFENPLLLFRLKERSSKAPSLVSQPWVGASSRLISLLSL